MSTDDGAPRPVVGLPEPALSESITLPEDTDALRAALRRLPARPGIFLLIDEHDATVTMVTTADLRRRARSRLLEGEDDLPSRRADVRSISRSVRYTTIGSAFEADWAFLQLARHHLPHVYRSVLDDWRAWFVHCDAGEDFPRWTRTAHPTPVSERPDEAWIGPMPDKQVAGKYRDMLESAFDLCRYHHILVQAPDGAACAYKEMGRCAAPCDGTVSLEHYRDQVRESIRFARTAHSSWRGEIESAMAAASVDLDFERAEALRRRLDETRIAGRPSMQHVGSIDAMKYLAVMPSGAESRVRLIVIRGGWITPVVDVATDADRGALASVAESVCGMLDGPCDWRQEAVENVAIVCRHLFREPRKRGPGRFMRFDDGIDAVSLARAIRSVSKSASNEDAALLDAQGDLDDPSSLA